MATIELSREESREGDLPFVCMVCGHAGHRYRRQIISYSPWWIYLGLPLGIVPYLILAWFFSHRRRLRAPLCELHQFHWLWRYAVSFGWLLGNACLLVASLFLLFFLYVEGPRPRSHDLRLAVYFVLIGSEVGLVLWPLLALTLKYTGIYASAVSPHSMTLTGVADEFIEALHVHREDRRPNLDREFGEGQP